MTDVSTLRDDLTFIVSVSYYFNHSFLQQAFTRKSKNSCRFKNFQEYPRFCEHLGYSRKFLNLHGLVDFLVKLAGICCLNIQEYP